MLPGSAAVASSAAEATRQKAKGKRQKEERSGTTMSTSYQPTPGERRSDRRRLSRSILRLGLFLSPFSFCLFPFAFAVQGDKEEIADPLPLRRVLLPAEKLPAELKRMREGV